MTLVARDVEDVKEILLSQGPCMPRGGGSKSGLSSPPSDVQVLDVSALRGVIEHLPTEFTLTARAATSVAEVRALLGEAGQYFPFDPMFVAGGATLGGTVASGISGPGRVRYGGVRDFILGVSLVDGTGVEVRGGGKVVKNAAGFDLPKLMVGSLGSLGVLTEITFKVFPAPESRRTVRGEAGSLRGAVECLLRLLRSPIELEAIDLDPSGSVWARIAGLRKSLPSRGDRLCELLACGEVLGEAEAEAFWAEYLELRWLREGDVAVRVPLTPRRISELDARLPESAVRRYSAAGQVAWIGWPATGPPLAELDELLRATGLGGLRVLGGEGCRCLGAFGDATVQQRVRSALDPDARLVEVH